MIDAYTPGPNAETGDGNRLLGFLRDYVRDPELTFDAGRDDLPSALAALQAMGAIPEGETVHALADLYQQYGALSDRLARHRQIHLPDCPVQVIAAADRSDRTFAGLVPLDVAVPALADRTVSVDGTDHFSIIDGAGTDRIVELINTATAIGAR